MGKIIAGAFLSLEEGVDIFLDQDDDKAMLETIEDLEEIQEKAYQGASRPKFREVALVPQKLQKLLEVLL